MRRRRRLLILVLTSVLVGCSDHSSLPTGPIATRTRHATQLPPGDPARTVAAVHLATWHLPYPVARSAVIPAGRGSVILAGGLLPGDVSTGRALRLDLGSGLDKTLPSLAVPVHDTAGGLVDGAPTVVAGGNATEQSVVQSLAHGRWRRAGNLPTTRSDLGVVEWRRHAYVIGGYDGASVPAAILRLSPGAAPRRVGTLLDGVRYAAMARIQSDLYVLGGEVDGRELDTIQHVDLATGHTRPAGRLPVPLGHAMAVAVGDRILLMGGRTGPDRQTDAMWWFNPSTRGFHRAGRLPAPLSDAAVASYGRGVWLLGGEMPAVTERVVAVDLR